MLKTFDILEYIINSGGKPVTPSELAEQIGLNAPTCIRLLNGLMRRGYIFKKSRREGYIPGPGIYALGNTDSFYSRLGYIAQPIIQRASEEVKHRVILTVAAGGRKFLLRQYDASTRQELNCVYNDFYTTTSGRFLLSYFSSSELDAYIKDNGLPGSQWNNICTQEQLETELEIIRKSAYYYFTDLQGNAYISVPLRIPGQPCFCVSTYVNSETEIAWAVKILQEAVNAIKMEVQPKLADL